MFKYQSLNNIKRIIFQLFLVSFITIGCSPLANSLLYPNRQPLIKNPSDYGMAFEEMTPEDYVDKIPVPVMYVQALNDTWTDIGQVGNFYAKSPEPKEILLLEGEMERFDTYYYFGNEPEKMLSFLAKYME